MGRPPSGSPLAERAAASAQVFVDDPAEPVVDPDGVHHLAAVLRLRPGECVIASDGRGRWRRCRYRGVSAGTGVAASGAGTGPGELLEPDGEVVCEHRTTPALTIAFAPAKGDRPEWVVQKLTELGIDRIVPLLVTRSVVRWDGPRAGRAVERLRRVAREAAAQSRRVWLPEVTAVCSLRALQEGSGPAAPAGGPLALAQLGGPPPAGPLGAVAIGPEGGWAPEETALGCPTVGLADAVLRAETAAVVAASILCALRAGTVAPGPAVSPAPGPVGLPDGEVGQSR